MCSHSYTALTHQNNVIISSLYHVSFSFLQVPGFLAKNQNKKQTKKKTLQSSNVHFISQHTSCVRRNRGREDTKSPWQVIKVILVKVIINIIILHECYFDFSSAPSCLCAQLRRVCFFFSVAFRSEKRNKLRSIIVLFISNVCSLVIVILQVYPFAYIL